MHFSSKPLQPFGELILEIAIPTNLSFKMPLVYRVTRELASHGYLPDGENPGVMTSSVMRPST